MSKRSEKIDITNSKLVGIHDFRKFDIKTIFRFGTTNSKLVGTNDIRNFDTKTRFRFDT